MEWPIAHASLGLSIIGLVLVIAVGGAYSVAASRPSPRGNRWPLARTLSFLSGLALFSLVVQSPLAVYDELRWMHSAQHLAGDDGRAAAARARARRSRCCCGACHRARGARSSASSTTPR